MTSEPEGCLICDGSGVVDSGGSTPWGEWIDVPCPCCDGRGKVVPCPECRGRGCDACHGNGVVGARKIGGAAS